MKEILIAISLSTDPQVEWIEHQSLYDGPQQVEDWNNLKKEDNHGNVYQEQQKCQNWRC